MLVLRRLAHATALFVEPPVSPARRGRGGWGRVGLAAGAVLVGTAVGLCRQPGVGALDTVWAEDGGIFLSDAAGHSPLAAISRSYAGYYHLVPRLLAGLATLAPAGAAAAVLALSAALCTALVALLVYTASADHLPSRLCRLLVSAIVVVVPVGQSDILNNIANLHWYGLYALFWLLLWTPRSVAGRAVAAIVVLLVAGSDILVLGFVPLALVRAVRRRADGRRDRHGILLGALLGLGLAVQFSGLLTGSSTRALSPDPVRAATGYVLRVVPAALIGQRWLGTQVDTGWLALAAVAWLLVVAAAVVVWLRLVRPRWPLAVAAALHSVALYVLPVLLTGEATPRYAVVPAMLVVTALVAVLQPDRSQSVAVLQPDGPQSVGLHRPDGSPAVPGRPDRGRLRLAAPLYTLAALLAVICAVNLRVDNARAHGPTWSAQLQLARIGCTGPDATVEVLIPPVKVTPPWLVRLPCRYLQR